MLLKGIAAVCAVFAAVLYLTVRPALWLTAVIFAAAYLVLFAAAVAFLWICCARVDMSVPQEEDSNFYRRLMHPYIEALITLVGVRLHT